MIKTNGTKNNLGDDRERHSEQHSGDLLQNDEVSAGEAFD
jgi:hypothetical protein